MNNTRASAYVYKGKLFVVGISESNNGVGPIPFNVAVPLDDNSQPEGPLDLSKATPAIEKALDEAREKVQESIKSGELQAAAEQLVVRSRAGDQNATAVIMATRNQAIKGVTRAIAACNAMKNYIKHNPVGRKKPTSFGIEKSIADAKSPIERNAAIVAYGPSLPAHYLMVSLANTPSINLAGIYSALEEKCRPSFKLGYRLSGSPGRFGKSVENLQKEDFDAAKLGFLFGRAERINAVRQGKPVSLLSKVAGWELGE